MEIASASLPSSVPSRGGPITAVLENARVEQSTIPFMTGKTNLEAKALLSISPTKSTPAKDSPAKSSPYESRPAKNSPLKAPIPVDMAMPYNLRPKWAIERNRPVFENEHELSQLAWESRKGSSGPLDQFWQHPVRYMPNVADRNLYRTLMIDFLPLTTTLKNVLALIRGGALESIQLFPPIGNVTDFITARVVFHYELPAIDMQLHWMRYPMTVHGYPIRVLLVNEVTYPKSRQLDEDVFMRCYTRILLIENVKEGIISLLPVILQRQMRMGFIIEIREANDGTPLVEFTSVVEAVKAMKQLQVEEAFQGAVFDFEDDYCQDGSY